MSIASEITVGTIAIVKIGRNEVEVTVTEITEHGWKVKSQSTGREFEVRRIERIVEEPAAEEAEPETEENAVNPAPESGSGPRHGPERGGTAHLSHGYRWRAHGPGLGAGAAASGLAAGSARPQRGQWLAGDYGESYGRGAGSHRSLHRNRLLGAFFCPRCARGFDFR